MQLFVKLPSQGTQLIYVYDFNTIKDVKNILNLTGFNLYTNKLLEDQYTIEHYGIVENSTIYALNRTVGGIPVMDAANDTAAVTQTATGISGMITRISQWMTDRIQRVKASIAEALHRHSEKLHWMKQLLTAMKFFPVITLVLIVLAFISRPLEAVMLIIGLLFVVVIYIIYSILNLPPFIYLVAWFYFMLFEIIPFVVYCIIFGTLLGLIFLICLILTGLNIITGGLLKDVVLCDNSPGAWYKTANHHLGNKWERGFLCARPCMPDYAPDATGMSCVRIAKGTPPYCPQAEIMRIYASKKADRNFMYKNFPENMNMKYMANPPEKREKMLAEYYLRKTKFVEKCKKEMREYDHIALNICASANTIGLDEKELANLKQVCAQMYCTADKNYPFCSKISSLKENSQNDILKQIIKVIAMILAFMIVIIFLFQIIYPKNS